LGYSALRDNALRESVLGWEEGISDNGARKVNQERLGRDLTALRRFLPWNGRPKAVLGIVAHWRPL
jgi:hypothetical protein